MLARAARRDDRHYEAQIDWIPLPLGTVLRPTQDKTPAVMQVSAGSQSFNAVNQLRVLGRWMRMITLPNQSSVTKAFLEFDDAGRVLSVLKSKVDQCGSQRSMTATGVRS